MPAPSISDYQHYADLQMAAEAFLRDPATGAMRSDLVAALTTGNKRRLELGLAMGYGTSRHRSGACAAASAYTCEAGLAGYAELCRADADKELKQAA
jgi:hypothetical protein